MRRIIQFRVFRGQDQYVAECFDLPVVTQAPTLDELAANIQEALELHLEGEDLAELGLSDMADATVNQNSAGRPSAAPRCSHPAFKRSV